MESVREGRIVDIVLGCLEEKGADATVRLLDCSCICALDCVALCVRVCEGSVRLSNKESWMRCREDKPRSALSSDPAMSALSADDTMALKAADDSPLAAPATPSPRLTSLLTSMCDAAPCDENRQAVGLASQTQCVFVLCV